MVCSVPHEHKNRKVVKMAAPVPKNNEGAALPVLVVNQQAIKGSIGGSVSTSSTFTDSQTSISNVTLPAGELKVAVMNVYNDGVHVDPDDHEGDKVQKLIQSYLFNGLKFCTGEGRPSNSIKQLFERIAVGKCHERPDLTEGNYANH